MKIGASVAFCVAVQHISATSDRNSSNKKRPGRKRKRGKQNSLPSPGPQGLSGTRPLAVLMLVHPSTAQEYRLATSDSFIEQDFDFNPTVFGAALLGLIRCCCSVFTHCAGSHDMPR